MDLATRISLLDCLRIDSVPKAWEGYFKKYGAVIMGFAQKQGLDQQGACDVLQETMMAVMRQSAALSPEAQAARGRSWLPTLVAHKVREARRRSEVEHALSTDAAPTLVMGSLPERHAADKPAAAGSLEESWRQSLIDEALKRVLTDSRVKPDVAEVFRACALRNKPLAHVAAQSGLEEKAVQQIKDSLMARLNELVAAMETGQPDAPSAEVQPTPIPR